MAKTKLEMTLETLDTIFRSLKPEEHYKPEQIKDAMDLADATIKAGQAAKKRIQTHLTNHHAQLTKHLFSINGTDTGTVNQHIGPMHSLKVVKTKKVEWKQSHLQDLYEKSKDDFEPYIHLTYGVKEAEYDKAPPIIKDQLDGGRTVKPSDPAFTIKER
jgi:hypothetical protein|tara:strand:- start:222 stop:698 length:477 start_codon:yes stop_codon:yes gene_type:complete